MASIKNFEEVGGYFGLELPDYGDPFSNTIKFQSGRSALRFAIERAGVRRLLLPVYVCDSVIQTVVDVGVEFKTYLLDDRLYPKDLSDHFHDQDALLYVNYFGLGQANISRLLQAAPRDRLIIDNCQALFAPPENVLATIYSPRKFIGVPDGGLLVTSGPIPKDDLQEDIDSIGRMRHLLLRMAYSAEQGYADHLASENLIGIEPLGMSRLSKRILRSVDTAAVKRKRRENFFTLAARLDGINRFRWKLDPVSVPLCYPLVLGRNVGGLRNALAEKGIYIPTYWPEIEGRDKLGPMEKTLVYRCLALPCDQRYSCKEMTYLADEVIALAAPDE